MDREALLYAEGCRASELLRFAIEQLNLEL